MRIIEKTDYIRPTFEIEVWPSQEGGWRRLLFWRQWFAEVTTYPHPDDPKYVWDEYTDINTGWLDYKHDFHAITFHRAFVKAERLINKLDDEMWERNGTIYSVSTGNRINGAVPELESEE